MKKIIIVITIFIVFPMLSHAKTIKIGLNYPASGPYSVQGLAQLRAAETAVAEINETGGILGNKISLVKMDTQSKADVSKRNVAKMIDQYNCSMVFGGSSSAVAIAGAEEARARNRIYFGTLTYSNATTGKKGHKYMFRECYNAWMAANVLSDYLKIYYTGKRYFFITADYTWGWSTEQSIRQFSGATDTEDHKGVKIPFPGAGRQDFKAALEKAQNEKADVLILVLFGDDMAEAVKLADSMGIKDKMDIVVPNLTLGMAESAGPQAMAGVVGAVPWCWRIPYLFGYTEGIKFVENFSKKYKCYPSSSAASAYTSLYQYRDAVERAGTFNTKKVIATLEGHKFKLLKSSQQWRNFDHQNLQTVYAVKCKSAEDILADKYQQDYFEYLTQMNGNTAARSQSKWMSVRRENGMSSDLQW